MSQPLLLQMLGESWTGWGGQDTGRWTWVPILLCHLGAVVLGQLPLPHSVFYKMDVTAPTHGTVVRIKYDHMGRAHMLWDARQALHKQCLSLLHTFCQSPST